MATEAPTQVMNETIQYQIGSEVDALVQEYKDEEYMPSKKSSAEKLIRIGFAAWKRSKEAELTATN